MRDNISIVVSISIFSLWLRISIVFFIFNLYLLSWSSVLLVFYILSVEQFTFLTVKIFNVKNLKSLVILFILELLIFIFFHINIRKQGRYKRVIGICFLVSGGSDQQSYASFFLRNDYSFRFPALIFTLTLQWPFPFSSSSSHCLPLNLYAFLLNPPMANVSLLTSQLKSDLLRDFP